MKRLIVGMTGATGAVFGVRLLEILAETEIETHLVVSKWAQRTLEHETGLTLRHLQGLADHSYGSAEMSAAISSGSFRTDGMVILPCSVRSLAAIAGGMGDHLVHRAADVILKERRKLVVVVREAPLNAIHLENMLRLARMGAVMFPPLPAFYNQPKTIEDLVDHILHRVLDQFDIDLGFDRRWDGEMNKAGGDAKPTAET
jgi:4-hydroxy-3-polyprenylbenzoate decarboxylase